MSGDRVQRVDHVKGHHAELVQDHRGVLVGLTLDGLNLIIPGEEPIRIGGGTWDFTRVTVTVVVSDLAVVKAEAS